LGPEHSDPESGDHDEVGNVDRLDAFFALYGRGAVKHHDG
jgi:hypothetical protein